MANAKTGSAPFPAGVAAPAVQVAVLVPCYNEERTIANVVAGFRASLPDATVYVYDNNSSDRTIEIATAAGAVVRSETRQGKGFVVRRMFADIDADVYVLVDGDDTYDAAAAPELVGRLVSERLDFVNGARRHEVAAAYRPGHQFGNRLLTGAVRQIFGRVFTDMLSGYKIFSRRYVRSFPAMSQGFEIETEFTIHALELQMPAAEIETAYRERPPGSQSKLRTIPDGIKISRLILRLIKDERPFAFFSLFAIISFGLGTLLGVPVIEEFLKTGLVPRQPTALLAASLYIIGALLFSVGLVLDLITKTRREMKRLAYLSIRPSW